MPIFGTIWHPEMVATPTFSNSYLYRACLGKLIVFVFSIEIIIGVFCTQVPFEHELPMIPHSKPVQTIEHLIVLGTILVFETIVLPRQARGKHKETLEQEACLCVAGSACQPVGW